MTSRATLLLLVLTAVNPAAATAQWALKSDPPAEKIDWPADVRPDLPGWQFPGALVFADQDGPYAAVGGWMGPWTGYDLRTGKAAGSVDPKVITGKASLNRDGTRLACVADGGQGKFVVAADTATGKEVRRIPVRSAAADIRFTARDRIAEFFWLRGPAADRGVRIVDVAAGTEGALLAEKVEHPRAVSPGGRYVAAAAEDRLHLVSAADGKVVMSLLLPQVDSAKPQKGPVKRYTAHALAFSPDGTKLGGIFNHHTTGDRVFWWNLDDGVRGGGYKVDEWSAEGRRFAWSADGAALLIQERTVVDAASGKVLWKLPKLEWLPTHTCRRLLSANRALSAEPAGGRNRNDYRLAVYTRP